MKDLGHGVTRVLLACCMLLLVVVFAPSRVEAITFTDSSFSSETVTTLAPFKPVGLTFAGTIADTNWHHVAVTFADATNVINIYVDGVLRMMATKALEADGAGHVVTIGNLHGANTFSGLLDDVRIYGRVLTLAEIQADRTTPIVP